MNPYRIQTKKGFTLIEMIVVVGIFSVVMTIAMGAIFTIVSANKSAQALASVMDNLNSALDTMSRNTRFGSSFQCNGTNISISRGGQSSCPTGNTWFGLIPYAPGGVEQPLTVYKFIKPSGSDTGSIWRCQAASKNATSFNGDSNCVLVTAPEVLIEKLTFFIDGTTVRQQQPRVFMQLQGYVLSGTTKQPFYVQTLISQRTLNI
jgi:prepilin-type N-terminal cleavage/methylation domain-containing protein